MKQAEIMDLLVEAGNEACSPDRLNTIHATLAGETAAAGPDGVYGHGPSRGLLIATEGLFMAVRRHDRSLFPRLFPAFALLCGDRGPQGVLAAEVEWPQMDRLPAGESSPPSQ